MYPDVAGIITWRHTDTTTKKVQTCTWWDMVRWQKRYVNGERPRDGIKCGEDNPKSYKWARVWTQTARKGLGNKIARKCLAGMPWFWIQETSSFRTSMWLVWYYSCNSMFYQYIRFLSLVKLEHWSAEVMFFPSSTLMAAFQSSRHFQARLFPRWVGSVLRTTTRPGRKGWNVMLTCRVIYELDWCQKCATTTFLQQLWPH